MTAKGALALLRKLTQQAGAGGGIQRITQAKRAVADTGTPETTTGRKQDFRRAVAHWGNLGAAGIIRKAGYAKRFQDTAANRDGAGAARNLALRLAEAAAALYGMKGAGGFDRRLADQAGAGSVTGGMVRFFRVLFGVGGGGDSAGRFVDRMRVVRDTETAGDAAGFTAEYLRGLFVEAGALAENRHTAGYERGVAEYADIEAVPLRHLSVFIRLVTGAYIRDFIIGRFLKSREEVVMKSPVCRELRFDSALH
jgi:phage shock protein PspC (stress-responsive transcriptional regulator)